MIIRSAVVVFALICLCGSAAMAGPTFYVGKGGSPVCDESTPLQDLLKSIDTNDQALQQKVIGGHHCVFLNEKTKVEVVDHFNSYGGNGVKIRVVISDKEYFLFTIDQGFTAAP